MNHEEESPPDDGRESYPEMQQGWHKANGTNPGKLKLVHASSENDDDIQPLDIPPASTWASLPEPPPRDWIMPDFIPAARVTSFLGNGGIGKTTVALQLATHIAASRPLFGSDITGGSVVGIFCEDEQDEIQRRWRIAANGERLNLESFDNLHLLSRDGEDNLLCTFDHDHIQFTRFYRQLEKTIADIRPRALFLDTAADIFAGDFMSTTHVRQFIKVCLGRFCVRYQCAVILLAHPSQSAINSGDGGGFSTAWNNSVRSRLYLRRPVSDDKEASKDKRILEVMKSNYGPTSTAIPLVYSQGCFVPDGEPLEEGKTVKAAKIPTRFSMKALDIVRAKGAGGLIVTFGVIFDAMVATGEIPVAMAEKPESARKALSRALKGLEKDDLLVQSTTPRGYRLPPQDRMG